MSNSKNINQGNWKNKYLDLKEKHDKMKRELLSLRRWGFFGLNNENGHHVFWDDIVKVIKND